MYNGVYGLGAVRSLDAFYEMCDVNFNTKHIGTRATNGRCDENLFATDTNTLAAVECAALAAAAAEIVPAATKSAGPHSLFAIL